MKRLTVDKETLQARIKACKACEHLKPGRLPNTYRCGKCGCFVHLKASYAKSACPAGKW